MSEGMLFGVPWETWMDLLVESVNRNVTPDRLILAVKAEMPCAWACDREQELSDVPVPLCPSCASRAELAKEDGDTGMRTWTYREAAIAGGPWMICRDGEEVCRMARWPATLDAQFIVDACNEAEQRPAPPPKWTGRYYDDPRPEEQRLRSLAGVDVARET